MARHTPAMSTCCLGLCRRRRQLADRLRHVGPGEALRQQQLDPALAAVDSGLDQGGMISLGEVWRQQADPRQVQSAVGEHLEDHREAAGRPSCGDALVGRPLAQVERVHAVLVHRGESLVAVEPARVHLGEVGDQLRDGLALAPHQERERGNELLVRQVLGEGYWTGVHGSP